MAIEGAPQGWMQDWSAVGSGKNAHVGVLLVHGFTGAPPSMRPWGEFLHSKGYTVRVPLLPGHGTTPEDLNEVKWQEWPDKVTKELRELQKSCDTIFLIGLSMGGGTVLNVAESNNDVIKGVILVNPWIHLKGITVELSFLVSRFRKMRASVEMTLSAQALQSGVTTQRRCAAFMKHSKCYELHARILAR